LIQQVNNQWQVLGCRAVKNPVTVEQTSPRNQGSTTQSGFRHAHGGGKRRDLVAALDTPRRPRRGKGTASPQPGGTCQGITCIGDQGRRGAGALFDMYCGAKAVEHRGLACRFGCPLISTGTETEKLH
jgi:hypothetical protein